MKKRYHLEDDHISDLKTKQQYYSLNQLCELLNLKEEEFNSLLLSNNFLELSYKEYSDLKWDIEYVLSKHRDELSAELIKHLDKIGVEIW